MKHIAITRRFFKDLVNYIYFSVHKFVTMVELSKFILT